MVTRSGASFQGCETAGSLDEALSLARQSDAMPMVIGGAGLYAQALPLATHLFLTRVERDVEADVFFPDFSEAEWREVRREAADGVTFLEWVRR